MEFDLVKVAGGKARRASMENRKAIVIYTEDSVKKHVYINVTVYKSDTAESIQKRAEEAAEIKMFKLSK